MRIDLNADLGEGFGVWRLGDDEALLDVDHQRQRRVRLPRRRPGRRCARVCAAAADRGVAIGAQVGYRDLAGFGRRRIDIDPDDLAADVLYQLGALDAFARAAGTRVRYVKPHGALYNTAADDAGAGRAAVARRRRRYDRDAAGARAAGSALADAAARGRRAVRAPRRSPIAPTPPHGRLRAALGSPAPCIDDPYEAVAARAVALRAATSAVTADGRHASSTGARGSLCVHGDTPGAVDLARRDAARRWPTPA